MSLSDPIHPNLAELRSAQPRSAQLSSAQLSPAQPSSAQLSPAQRSSEQLNPAQPSSAQLAWFEKTGTAQYRLGMLFLFTKHFAGDHFLLLRAPRKKKEHDGGIAQRTSIMLFHLKFPQNFQKVVPLLIPIDPFKRVQGSAERRKPLR